MTCDTNLLSGGEVLCTECLFHLPFTDFHLDTNNSWARQISKKVQFENVFSMLHLAKSSRVEILLNRSKYKNQP